MATYEITAPDGSSWEVTAPDDASQDQVLAYAQSQWSGQQQREPNAAMRVAGDLARQVGLTARAGIKGVAALPNAVLGVLTGDPGYFSQRLDALLNRVLPQPETATERVAGDVAGAMAGAGGSVGLGGLLGNAVSPVVSRIGQVLSSGPGTQIASGAAGAAAGGLTREAGGGPLAQLGASLAGSIAVPAAIGGAQEGIRRSMRGGEEGQQKILQNLETFRQAGTTPTVGQATESRVMRAAESGLAKVPGGAGIMARKGETEARQIGESVDDIVGQLTPRAGAEPAGRAIKSGIEAFVERFRTRANELYDTLDEHIPANRPVEVSSTRTALKDLNADIPGAPALSQWFKNSKIRGIQGALESDVAGAGVLGNPVTQNQAKLLAAAQEADTLPYEAVKKLRTLVGKEIENTNLVSDVPRSKWKTLYAALSDDLERAANGTSKEASAAFSRANTFYKAGIKRIDDVLGPIASKTDPEDMFKAAMSGTREGATKIWGVMRSLDPEARKTLAGTVIKRLGIATPGKQDDVGEVFSTETFLTNWNRISQPAKTALFSGLPSSMRRDLDAIAKAASNIREGSKVFQNPSGTSQAESWRFGVGGIALSLLLGQPGMAAGISGAIVGANQGAKLLTNPDFVRWLARSTQIPGGSIAGQINTLAQIANRQPPEDREAIMEFTEQIRQAQ